MSDLAKLEDDIRRTNTEMDVVREPLKGFNGSPIEEVRSITLVERVLDRLLNESTGCAYLSARFDRLAKYEYTRNVVRIPGGPERIPSLNVKRVAACMTAYSYARVFGLSEDSLIAVINDYDTDKHAIAFEETGDVIHWITKYGVRHIDDIPVAVSYCNGTRAYGSSFTKEEFLRRYDCDQSRKLGWSVSSYGHLLDLVYSLLSWYVIVDADTKVATSAARSSSGWENVEVHKADGSCQRWHLRSAIVSDFAHTIKFRSEMMRNYDKLTADLSSAITQSRK